MKHTFGRFYPGAGKGDSLCHTCIHGDEKCTFPGRQVVRCPEYAEEMRR
jgi:hypothetical protein